MNTVPDLISKLKSWMNLHFLKLNESKTEIIIFNRSYSTECNIFGTFTNTGKCIRLNNVVKYLGVYLDSSLNFITHINKITSECYMYIRKIKSIRKFLSQNDCEALVHAFISSRIDMCNSLFLGLPKATLLKLQRIQNAAVRVIFNVRKRESVSQSLKSLHWLDIEQIIVYKVLLLTFKCIHDLAPSPLKSLLVIKDPNTLLLDVTSFFPSSELGRRAFRYSSPRLWNSIPSYIRLIANLDSFKKKLKHHIFINFDALMKQYKKYLI